MRVLGNDGLFWGVVLGSGSGEILGSDGWLWGVMGCSGEWLWGVIGGSGEILGSDWWFLCEGYSCRQSTAQMW